MASYHNVSKNLLAAAKRFQDNGRPVDDKTVEELSRKLLSYDPYTGDDPKAKKIDSLLKLLIGAEEDSVDILKEDPEGLIKIYDTAVERINAWGGITGYFGPEGGSKKG